MKESDTVLVRFAALMLILVWVKAYPDDPGFEDDELSRSDTSSEQSKQITPKDFSHPDVLNPTNHPESPETRLLMRRNPVALDHNLSWTERFLGDEEFNPAVRLPEGEALSPASTGQQLVKSEQARTGKFDAMGTIKGIQPSSRKVKIDHGPIPKLDMPAMSMMFKADPALSIEGLEKGQEVGFDVESTSAGMILTQITPINDSTESGQKAGLAGRGDAMGVVKSVKPESGKVKIKHGPIEKLGMPGMTMVFGVSDPAMLEKLKAGETIRFDVDSTSAGFVITRIEAATEAGQ